MKTYTKKEIMVMILDAATEVARQTDPLAMLVGGTIAGEVMKKIDQDEKKEEKEVTEN